jgi:hypothetical protein
MRITRGEAPRYKNGRKKEKLKMVDRVKLAV